MFVTYKGAKGQLRYPSMYIPIKFSTWPNLLEVLNPQGCLQKNRFGVCHHEEIDKLRREWGSWANKSYKFCM
jgi:hypothetical protein